MDMNTVANNCRNHKTHPFDDDQKWLPCHPWHVTSLQADDVLSARSLLAAVSMSMTVQSTVVVLFGCGQCHLGRRYMNSLSLSTPCWRHQNSYLPLLISRRGSTSSWQVECQVYAIVMQHPWITPIKNTNKYLGCCQQPMQNGSDYSFITCSKICWFLFKTEWKYYKNG